MADSSVRIKMSRHIVQNRRLRTQWAKLVLRSVRLVSLWKDKKENYNKFLKQLEQLEQR